MIGRNDIESYLNKLGQLMETSINEAVPVIGEIEGIDVLRRKRKTLLYNEEYIYYWNIHSIFQKWKIYQERDVQQYLNRGISK